MVVAFEVADLTLRGRGAATPCTRGAGLSLRFIVAATEGIAVLSEVYDVHDVGS